MLFGSIITQMKIISKHKIFILSIVVIYAFIIINFAKNLRDFYGYDIRRLIHPMKMTMLNTYGKWGFYFMQYFPILLAFPASLSFLKDKDNGTEVYLRSKFGNRNYYYGKIIAVFIMTFIAFALPQFFEYILNIITFPIEAIGDQSNLSTFDPTYHEQVEKYWLSSLWKANPYFYYIFYIAMFSSVAAAFAAFTVGLSMTNIMKYKILALLPAYLILTLLSAVGSKINFPMNYVFYLMSFDASEKFDLLYPMISLVLFLISIVIARYKGKEAI